MVNDLLTFNETEVQRMQVSVKDLLPNPYRRMERYHLQPERLNALVRSIRETSFWDNILARPNPTKEGTYQIAYGHHRLEAVRQCNIKKIDIPVKDLDDTLMVKIMANESMSEWHMDTSVMNQTIWAVQDFILEAVKTGKINPGLSKNAIIYIEKNGHVGKRILIDFLGDSWATRIQTALELRKLEKEDPELLEAAEEIKTPSVAKEFQKAVKDYKIPKEQYKTLARNIQSKGKSSAQAVKEVRSHRPKVPPRKGRDTLLDEIERMIASTDDDIKRAYTSIWHTCQKLELLEIDEISGIKAAISLESITKILKQIKKYLAFFGYHISAKEDNLIGGGK